MGTLENLLTLAKSQVGYTEKDNDKDLDTQVGATAGDGNHTKYARDLTAMGLPGYCGSAWCAVYQMWLEVKTVGKEQALKNMGSKFYNCFAIRDYAKGLKRWMEASGTPKPGYLVIFRQSHIARVTKVSVSEGKIYTNEGNTSNGTAVVRNGGMVCEKSYALTNDSILGYVATEYQEVKKSGWHHEDGGERFYNGDTGLPVQNDWLEDAGYWYWFDGAGLMVNNTWKTGKDGKWYFLAGNGVMAKNQWIICKDELYRVAEDGSMVEGELRLATDDRGAFKIASR